MNSILQTYKRLFCMLLAVYNSFAMFSNTTKILHNPNGTIITGLEKVHIAPDATEKEATLYISDKTVFYNEGTLSAKVVFLADTVTTPKHQKRLVSQQNVKQSSTIASQAELRSSPAYPFSGGSRNALLCGNDAPLPLPFSGKNSKKNSVTTLQLSLFALYSDDAALELATKNSLSYSLCSVRHSFYNTTSLFGRPPPFLVGSC
jgi:hypothetical protein